MGILVDERRIRAVLFDLDGVLVNSIPFHGLAWQWIMRTLGLEVDPLVAPLTEGLHSRTIARLIFESANHQRGLEMDDVALDELLDRKRAYYRKIVGNLSITPEVEAMIRDVRKRFDSIALVTSTSRENLDHIVTAEQQALFEAVLWAGSVTRSKPDPEPYSRAAQMLGMQAHHCVVIENAPLGIRSARAAGCWCVAITSTMSADRLGEAHLVVENVLELSKDDTWIRLNKLVLSEDSPGLLEPGLDLVDSIPVRSLE